MTGNVKPVKISPCRVVKRSVAVAGHPTSVTMEFAFWEILDQIAARDDMSVSALITAVDEVNKGKCTLSAALRVYILKRVTR